MTIAYEASKFVLLIDRQFVSMLFPLSVYAKYAFAYNILSCVTAVIISVSTVLFPRLKRMSREESTAFFPRYMGLLTMVVCFFLAGYYPIVWIVQGMLPGYQDSLVYFKIVFPVLALSSCITIILFSYYKIYDKIHIFLYVCLGTLVLSILTNGAAYLWFHSAEAISFASVMTTIVWYLLSIRYLVKNYHVQWVSNFLYTLIMIAVFYLCVFVLDHPLFSMLGYVVLFLVITCLFQKENLQRKH